MDFTTDQQLVITKIIIELPDTSRPNLVQRPTGGGARLVDNMMIFYKKVKQILPKYDNSHFTLQLMSVMWS